MEYQKDLLINLLIFIAFFDHIYHAMCVSIYLSIYLRKVVVKFGCWVGLGI